MIQAIRASQLQKPLEHILDRLDELWSWRCNGSHPLGQFSIGRRPLDMGIVVDNVDCLHNASEVKAPLHIELFEMILEIHGFVAEKPGL